MQISLAIAVTRCRGADPAIVDRVLDGQLDGAVHTGTQRLRRMPSSLAPMERSLIGQLVARTLLALGREDVAQEIMRDMRRSYDEVSRAWVRWSASLDQGWVFLWQNRPGRAIECFRAVAADPEVMPDLAVEAHNCLADALASLGEYARALQSVEQAAALCEKPPQTAMARLVDCHRLELLVMQAARRSQELSDHALMTGTQTPGETLDIGALRHELAVRERDLAGCGLVVHRLQHLQLQLTCLAGGPHGVRFFECLGWLKERRLAGLEPNARIESAMALLAGGATQAAGNVLGTMVQSESQARQSRYSIDLQYCRSKLLMMHGQMSDSMRAYKQHVEDAVYVLRRDFEQASQVKPVTQPAPVDGGDAQRLRLPLKYRSAYKFILEHLAEPELSIKEVAAHVGVTERSLQLAFRMHLGLTPAEFIRKRRMEGIRSDLEASGSTGAKVSVLDVASRWGVSNRSTLAQNYRQVYAETPFETLHGKLRTEDPK